MQEEEQRRIEEERRRIEREEIERAQNAAVFENTEIPQIATPKRKSPDKV